MRIEKVVFPAAGMGTRFLPATKAQPKEMLPLIDKPIIQYGVEEALKSGIENIIIVTGRGKNAIEDHFDVSFELERFLEEKGKMRELQEIRNISDLVNVAYIRQKEPMGLGHAVLVAKNLVGDEPFAVLLADDIIESKVPCLKQLILTHRKYGCSVIAVERVERKRTRDYGIIDCGKIGDGAYEIKDLVEKPSPSEAPSTLAIIGRYILTPAIFRNLENTALDKRGELQLTNGLRRLLKEERIIALEFEGRRYDAGNKLEYLKATVELALNRKDLAKDFWRYLRSLALRK
ncbi:MAG: UTP--glucose-1-phosphate uridylyltransferase GalU [Acidobacteriota bacterium]